MTTVPFHDKTSAWKLIEALRGGEDQPPLSAMIQVADRCNEVCVHCYQIQGEKGELDTDDWRTILDELAELGVLFLTISGGEATLRKDFLELVTHARRLKFAVKLYTNGLTMTRELAQTLADLAVQEVQISLYSPVAETHDWVTRVPGSFDKATRGARYLVQAGVGVLLKTPLMTFNVDDVDAYIGLATEIGADYAFDPGIDARSDGDRSPEAFAIDMETRSRVFDDPRLGRPFSGPLTKISLEHSVCGACSGSVHIEPNGEMRPCTMLTSSVGHAIHDGIGQAWKNNPTGRTIRAMTWGDLPGCRDCDLRSYCNRCFSTSRTETGSALVPYETACERARYEYGRVTGTAPEIAALPGSDIAMGPYRETKAGLFECDEYTLTEADRELASQAWTRGEASPAPKKRASPGNLVQIRRPGSKRVSEERVPNGNRSRRDDIELRGGPSNNGLQSLEFGADTP